jgi:ribosomal protein RSM22 (predicted rRNA methylase)
VNTPGALAAAIDAAVPAADPAVVQRLISAYRSGEPPAGVLLSSAGTAAAYAGYRMPATAAAAGAVLAQVRRGLPGWAPETLLDLGAGTGATAWAAAGELPTLRAATLLEPAAGAIAIGRAVLAQASATVLQEATWRPWQLGSTVEVTADLATAGYVLGELAPENQAELVTAAATAAPVVVLIEPGTPAGHRRILAARDQLLAAGHTVVAPCPHQLPCPLAAAGDWCHLAARVQRSAAHRRLKTAELSYEDEKFAYVATARAGQVDLPAARIIRRPRHRKGLVTLELCKADGTAREHAVGRRDPDTYRRARKASWGDPF